MITLQAEDEIAAANVALGAAFAGHLAVTGTSGPGMDLKAETLGLAVIMELPMVIVDVQRGGPSTGLPTKTEQGDLLLAMFGRHGESPMPIVAPSSPADCFDAALEAARIAVRYRTPVIVLSDTFLSNSSEPWRVPEVDDLPVIDPNFAVANGDGFLPYARDERLARPWAVPGTPGLVHRIGGLEREDLTGNISYEPENHERMTHLRQAKVDGVADDIPPLEVDDPTGDAELLVLGWGSSLGTIRAAARRVRAAGGKVATAHLRHLNPFPPNTGEVVRAYPQGADPRDEPRAARDADQGEVPGRREELHQGAGPPDLRGGARAEISGCSMSDETAVRAARVDRRRQRRRGDAHEEGLHLRPGGAVVSGLRRLRDPVGRAGASCPSSASSRTRPCS